MEELTCPNCNVDIAKEEAKRNNLCCPTCGFDLTASDEVEATELADEVAEDEDEDDEEEE